MPSSPRGWFCRAHYVLDAQARPFSPSYEYTGRSDQRTRSSREESLSIKIIAERASKACTSNGVGYALMRAYFLEEVSFLSLTENEKWLLEKTIRRFRRDLQAAGFLPDDQGDASPGEAHDR
jgi:hypothetical protein